MMHGTMSLKKTVPYSDPYEHEYKQKPYAPTKQGKQPRK